MSSDSEDEGPLMNFGAMEQQLMWQILSAKNGLPSSLPSAFLEDELFEEPYTMAEIVADPSKHILWAAENNKKEMVENLIRADSGLVNARDDDAYTPLHRASYNGHLDVISLLLANGADICSKTVDGWQPFHSACRWDNVDAAKLLISKGADVHCKTNGNNTALHLAASNGNAESAVKFLLQETDIDISVVNCGGDTARQLAERNSPFAKYFTSLRKSAADKVSEKDGRGLSNQASIPEESESGVATSQRSKEQISSSQAPQSNVPMTEPQSNVPVTEPQSNVPVTEPQSNVLVTEPQSNVPVTGPQSNVPVTGPQSNVPVTGPQSNVPVTEAPQAKKVVIVPGNGGGDVYRANWYGWAHRTLSKDKRIECRLENMPDPVIARENVWIPFMEKELECDESTIIIGHSSGAAAALRYAESHKVFALVLVAAYVSDLGEEMERKSGYFSRPWLWHNIQSNCQHIIQFGSSDDPFLPWEEQTLVAKETGATFHSSDQAGHYMNSSFPELIKAVRGLVNR